jgi:hypothetical protein
MVRPAISFGRLSSKDAMLIPQKATYEVLEKRYVFVVDAEGNVSSGKSKFPLN